MKLQENWIDIRYLDQLACHSTILHRLHPATKLVVTAAFVLTVTSYGKYSISALLPLFLFPIIQLSLGNFPVQLFTKRLMLVSPFVLCVGIYCTLVR
jgi:cobalt/nickel transport system permease protein